MAPGGERLSGFGAGVNRYVEPLVGLRRQDDQAAASRVDLSHGVRGGTARDRLRDPEDIGGRGLVHAAERKATDPDRRGWLRRGWIDRAVQCGDRSADS